MSTAAPLFVAEKQPLEAVKELNAQGLLLATGCGVPQVRCSRATETAIAV